MLFYEASLTTWQNENVQSIYSGIRTHSYFQNSKRKFLTQVLSPGNLSDTLEQYFPREVKEQRESFSPGGASYYVSKE